MAAWQQRIKVPNFSKSALSLADLCARELWKGTNYENGKKQAIHRIVKKGNVHTSSLIDMSDEQIMKIFATPFYKRIANPKYHMAITDNEVEDFIKIAKIQIVKTRQSNLDYQKGIAVIDKDISKLYKGWNLKNTEKNYSAIGFEFTKMLSDGLFTSSSFQRQGNHFALASRILFFTIPDISLYNYSTGIVSGMKLNDPNSDEVLSSYITALQDGLERNWNELSKYEMPYPTSLDEAIWIKARNSGWWQRRVLDLALKFYFSESKTGEREFKINNFVTEMFLTLPQTH